MLYKSGLGFRVTGQFNNQQSPVNHQYLSRFFNVKLRGLTLLAVQTAGEEQLCSGISTKVLYSLIQFHVLKECSILHNRQEPAFHTDGN
jgi:hypothetical protein